MNICFVYTIKSFNYKTKKVLQANIDLLGKYNNFEFVILSCSTNNDLDIFMKEAINKNSEIKYYRPEKGNVSSAKLKNYFLKKADNKVISFLNEKNIINYYLLLKLVSLKSDNVIFADDSRYGVYLTAFRNTFLKMNGFDVTLFSTNIDIEDEDLKNRIIFSHTAYPLTLYYKKLGSDKEIDLDCDEIVANEYDNFTPFKNISNKTFFLNNIIECDNIIFN